MQLIDRRLGLRLLAIAAVSSGAAVAVGLAIGGAVYALLMADAQRDGWAELGAAIFGLGVGMVVGVVTYVFVVTVGVHRVQRAGRRLRPAFALTLLPLSLVVVTGLSSEAAGPYAPDSGIAVAAFALVLAVLVAHIGIAGAVVGRLAAVAFIALLAIGVGAMVTTSVVAANAERDAKRKTIERIGVLPLVDGRSLDEPYPGWTVRRVHYSRYSDTIEVTWDAPSGGDAHLLIDSAKDYLVRVHTADGIAIERDLAARLQPVSPSAFLAACGRHC